MMVCLMKYMNKPISPANKSTNNPKNNNCIISIIQINLNGKIINVFNNKILNNPRGLCFNSDGKLYICNFGSGTVYSMTS